MRTLNEWLHPPPSPPGPFDLFVFHSIWNYKEVRKVMGKSAVTITILRDPVSTFESGYSYFGRAPKVIFSLLYLVINVHTYLNLLEKICVSNRFVCIFRTSTDMWKNSWNIQVQPMPKRLETNIAINFLLSVQIQLKTWRIITLAIIILLTNW